MQQYWVGHCIHFGTSIVKSLLSLWNCKPKVSKIVSIYESNVGINAYVALDMYHMCQVGAKCGDDTRRLNHSIPDFEPSYDNVQLAVSSQLTPYWKGILTKYWQVTIEVNRIDRDNAISSIARVLLKFPLVLVRQTDQSSK